MERPIHRWPRSPARRILRSAHPRSTPARQKNQQRSHSILVARYRRVDSLQEATHRSWRSDRNELDAIEVLQRFHLLPRLQPKGLTDLQRDDNLELWR